MGDFLVSVIIPIHNVEPYIEKCLDSLLQQTIKIQIILIDDGSTDGSAGICNKYISDNVIFIQQKNSGVSAARNAGLELAEGRYIGFVDPDDWIEKDMFYNLSKKMEQTLSDIIVSDYFINLENEQTLIKTDIWQKILEGEDINDKLLTRLLGKNYLGSNNDLIMGSVCRCLFRAELIKGNNIQFNAKLFIAEDLVFFIEAIQKAERICIDKNAYYHYRIRENSATHVYNPDFFSNNIRLVELIRQKTDGQEMQQKEIRIQLRIVEIFISAVIQEIRSKDKKKVRRNIAEICNNSLLRNALNEDTFERMNLKYKIWVYLILIKNTTILRLYYYCLELYRRNIFKNIKHIV